MFFAFGTALYWYRIQVMVETIIIEILATYTLKKRNGFAWRLPLSILSLLAVAVCYPTFDNGELSLCVVFLLFFVLSALALCFVYDEKMLSVFSCCMMAYALRHFAYILNSLFEQTLNFTVTNPYEITTAYRFDPIQFSIYITIFALSYWVGWAFLFRPIRLARDISIKNLPLAVVSATIVLADIILNIFVVEDMSKSLLTSIIIDLYGLIFSVIAMAFFLLSFSNKTLENELEMAKMLRAKDQKNYETIKNNIDLINVKCHDLKHMLNSFDNLTAEERKTLANAINIYDSPAVTSSEVLNVVLAEKGAVAVKEGVEFNYLIDPVDFSFVVQSDLYSLFENILSNALEALAKVTDKDKKVLRLRIKEKHAMVSIHLENYFDSNNVFVCNDDGTFKTSKDDNLNHGFGLRSVKMVVESLDGALTISTDEDLFMLDILLPKQSVK